MALERITKENFIPSGPKFRVYDYWYNLIVDAINNASTTLEQTTTGITAFATGGQASATQLSTYYNNITVCATAGDSVKLPTAAVSTVCIVKNNGNASLNVFPNTDDCINALAANLAVAVPINAEVKFVAKDATTWESNSETLVLSSPSTQKGQLVIRAANSAGETVTLITNRSQAAARVYTIPDAGGDADFVMSTGGDADKTVTLHENLVIAEGSDITLTAEDAASSITLDEQTFEVEGEGTATRLTKIVNAADAAATLTLSGTSCAINQDVQTTASPTFVRTHVGVGAVGTPSVTIGSTDTGFYQVSGAQTGFSQDGALVAIFDSEGIKPDSVQGRAAFGTTPVGTVTFKEYGDGRDMTTVLTLTNFIVGALAGAAADLGVGHIVYAFPAGQHIELAYSLSSLVLTAAGTAVATDTGLGSVIASGVIAVLSGTSTFEDRLTGQTINTAAGGGAAVSALKAATAGIGAGIALNVAANVKNVFLNSAGTWNADNTGNLTASGTITLKWTIM